MTAPLTAILFGRPRFSSASEPVVCASKKSVALFVFLLLSGKTHSRRELARLFWGARDGEAARASLRAALHRLPAPMADCLTVERESVGLAPAAAPLVDVERFQTLARADVLDDLETASSLYEDELLKDFEADATPEFDDWLHSERVRLAQLAQEVFGRVIEQRVKRARDEAARGTSEREAALATGRRWVALMPGVEAAHRWLMRIYLDMGSRDGAIEQYELCQRFLAVAHGRAPSPETRALHDEALAGQAPSATSAASIERAPSRGAQANRLETDLVPATSFVGRIEELAELDGLLADPDCRLITLHGLGGTGKTRLARALAIQAAPRFERGATWVALESTQSPDALPSAIAAALGRELPAQGDRSGAVAAMLAGQQRLLVLDNFESLLTDGSGADDANPLELVLRILQTAPGVRIVVTSREVLGLQEEWVYGVRGLPYPADDGGGTGIAASAAVELFTQRARQAYIGFSLAAEAPHVLRICRLVEGLPLALELAAAWVRTVPCGDIAAAIENEAAALASRHRNRPGRHQTLDAVVAYSWNLLADEQQHALAGLGLFVGGFTREAAERVANAPLRTLSALVDKALVRRQAQGRYDLHALVRKFALARLDKMPSRRVAASRRYVDHFAASVLEMFTDARGPSEAAAAARFATELPNMLACWTRSLAEGRLDVAERMAAPLIALLHTRGFVRDALRIGEQAVTALRDSWHDDVAALVRLQWGRAAVTGGVPDVALRELDAALAYARAAGRPEAIARALYYRGSLAYQQSDLDGAERMGAEALIQARKTDVPELHCLAHNICGTLANMRSRFDVAEHHLRQALDAARLHGAPSLIAGMLCSLGVPLYYSGRYAEARALNREAADIFEALGRAPIAITVRGNLAGIALEMGDVEGAQTDAELAIRMSRDFGDEDSLAATLATLADILLERGQLANAQAAAEESLVRARALERGLAITEDLFLLSTIALREGDRDQALAHLLELRDALAKYRLVVRVPMLVLAAAQWAASSGDASSRNDARRWLEALSELPDTDMSLRRKGRALLASDWTANGEAPTGVVALSLSELEAEVQTYLAAY